MPLSILLGKKEVDVTEISYIHSRWLRRRDLNPRPSGYEPDELPNCSTPRYNCAPQSLYIIPQCAPQVNTRAEKIFRGSKYPPQSCGPCASVRRRISIYFNKVFDTNWLKLDGKCNFCVIFGVKGRKVTKILQRARQYSCATELGMW